MTGRIVWGEHGKANRYYLDGAEVSEREFEAGFPDKEGVPGTASLPGWPMRSVALAVHPDQVAEANARNAARGCSVTYESDGTAVIPDRAERRRLLRIEGFHDKQGGYGD